MKLTFNVTDFFRNVKFTAGSIAICCFSVKYFTARRGYVTQSKFCGMGELIIRHQYTLKPEKLWSKCNYWMAPYSFKKFTPLLEPNSINRHHTIFFHCEKLQTYHTQF